MRARGRTEVATQASRRAFDRYARDVVNESRLSQLQRSVAREPMTIVSHSRHWDGRVALLLADGTQLLMRGGSGLLRSLPTSLVSLDLVEGSGRWTVTGRTSAGDDVVCSVRALQRQPVSPGPR